VYERCYIRGWCLQVVFLGEEGLDAGGVRKVSDSVSTLSMYMHTGLTSLTRLCSDTSTKLCVNLSYNNKATVASP